MNGTNNRYLVDTNPVIYFMDNKIPALPIGERFVSVITEMELLVHPGLTPEKERYILRFLDTATIIPLTEDIKLEAIRIRRYGVPRLKLADAIIAATAVIFDAALVTDNRDMLKLEWPGLQAINVR
jgi:predicted nucleic acid-binding protein